MNTAPLRPAKPVQLAPWPHFSGEEMDAVAAVLRSGKVNYWTGNEGKAFEREYAVHVGVNHAIAAANGTVTLEMALEALGVGEGDEVVVAPRSFMASVSCVVTCDAKPIFADVDRNSGTLSAATIAEVLTPRTKAIIPVHLGGWPCEMDEIMRLAKEKGLAVIEDCAQAHGATYRGRAVGSIGHVNSFSFCQDKIITTGGEGGMITTNDKALWERMWALKEHGKNYDACFNRQWPPGFRWLHESFGSNYRMTEMQAAIGRIALRNLSLSNRARRQNAERLAQSLSKFPIVRVPKVPDYIEHAYYKFYCYVEAAALSKEWTRDRIMAEISARGVPCFSGSCSEIYREKAFDAPGFRPPARLPIARELGETSLMFLVHPTITAPQLDWMCAEIEEVLTFACN